MIDDDALVFTNGEVVDALRAELERVRLRLAQAEMLLRGVHDEDQSSTKLHNDIAAYLAGAEGDGK